MGPPGDGLHGDLVGLVGPGEHRLPRGRGAEGGETGRDQEGDAHERGRAGDGRARSRKVRGRSVPVQMRRAEFGVEMGTQAGARKIRARDLS